MFNRKYIPFTDPDIENIRKMQSDILKMSYEGLLKEMPLEKFTEALHFVNEELNLPVTSRTFEIILSSNGYAYSNIIEFGIEDTETRSAISNAVANFYMHRPWPLNLENGFPGVHEFKKRLLEEVINRNIAS